MEKNKKILLSLVLIIALFLCLNMKGNASDPEWDFPSEIYSSNYGLMNQDGVNIYEKGYSKEGYGSGRAFCTLFYNDFLSGTCTSTWWNTDNNKNKKIAVAVGNMIKTARDITAKGGSIDQDVYFYTEIAINRFLYLYNGNHYVNNVARLLNWRNVSSRYTFKKIYSAGVDAYNNYGDPSAKFANLSISDNGNGKYTATADFICYDLENNRVRCNAACKDKVILTATYSDGTKSAPIKSGTCERASDGMYYKYKGEATFNIPENKTIKEVKANFNTTNKASYRVAHEYYCRSPYNQNLTPNLLGTINEEHEISKSITKTISTTPDNPPTANTSSTCEQKLQKIKSTNYSSEIQRKQALENLYKEYYAKHENYTQLLNFNNPECAVATCSNKLTTSCLTASSSDSSFNKDNLSCYTNLIDSNGKTGYCMTKFNLKPTDSYNVKKVNSGQLYFNVDKGELLEGDFSQICYSADNTNLIPKENGTISDYIKNISLKGTSDTIKLSLKENKTVSLTAGENNSLYYGTDIKYTIPEIWIELGGKKLSKKECENKNCILAGYGIISPLKDTKTKNNKIDKYDFKIMFNNKKETAICQYEYEPQIINSQDKVDLEFRIIDTDKPFTNRVSETRNTMTNWCSDVNKVNKNIISNSFDSKTSENSEELNKQIKASEDRSKNLNSIIEQNEINNSTVDIENGNTQLTVPDSNIISGNDKLPSNNKEAGDDSKLSKLQFIDKFNLVRMQAKDSMNLAKIMYAIEKYKAGVTSKNEVETLIQNLKSSGGFGEYYDLLDKGDIYKDGQINELDYNIIFNIANGTPIDIFEEPCSSNNYVVQKNIKEKANSYGKKYSSDGEIKTVNPKYKITLTPQLMEDIKKKAKDYNITYNNFNLECEDIGGFNICRSKLLNELRTLDKLKFNSN